MIRLKDTHHQNTAAFLETAASIAGYYGFTPLESLQRLPAAALAHRKLLSLSELESQIAFARRDEKPLMAAARRGIVSVKQSGALLAWRVIRGSAAMPTVSFELHVIGPKTTVAEALLIVVANAIIEESGAGEHVLSINNIGSPESNGRYVRDVSSYLRKHIDSISPNLRERVVSDPLGTLVQLIERGHPAVPRAPQPMEYLTEDERRRFWELLEYLEVFGLPYELSPHILGSRDCWSHALFEISTLDAESGSRLPVAFGGRYDPLISRIARTPESAAMVSITCEVKGSARTPSGKRAASEITPAIYFAHLGIEARRRALPVLEMLRGADIPVHQSLWHEQIGEQMAAARRLGTPYILIMGHKEAVEGTILVREVATNSQEAVLLPELTTYLKKHRVAIR
jgi:histidyl-tRNA synthetase